jgi:NitT/TauT family transport system substrate-binding protein
MAARAGVTAEEYAAFMGGTKLLTLAEGAKVMSSKAAGFGSVLGSAKIANEFNVKNEVYKEAQDVASYLDASLQVEAAGK